MRNKHSKELFNEEKIIGQFKEFLKKMQVTKEVPDITEFFEQRYKHYYVQANMTDNLVELIFIHKKTQEHYNIIIEIK